MKNLTIFSFIILLSNVSYAQQTEITVEEASTVFVLGLVLNIFFMILPFIVMFMMALSIKLGQSPNYTRAAIIMYGYSYGTAISVIVLIVLSVLCNNELHNTEAMIFAIAALISRMVLFFVITYWYDNNMSYLDRRQKYLEWGMYTFIVLYYMSNILFILYIF